jgi:SHS2 domain-containing protein
VARNKYRYLEQIATADAAFEAFGESLSELFANAAAAMFNVLAPIELIKPVQERELTVMAENEEELLFGWLAELVYLKDVNGELYSEFDVNIDDASHTLSATVRGEAISNHLANTHTDVKAVTYHRLAIVKSEEGYTATVVLDL